jgi:RNA polymerase sigma factor (sigma-70 family)
VGGQAVDDDPVASFLRDLGYRVEPTEWNIDGLTPGAQRFVRRFRLMCHYPDAVSPFQVFHIELHDYGTRYLAIRAVLDPFYRASPQGNYLFVLSYRSSVLTLVNPKPASGLLAPIRYRTLRVIPNALSPFPRRIVESLRLLPGEQSAGAEQIAEKHRRTFDALQHLRRREREEIVELDPYRLFLDDLQSYPVLPHEEQLRLACQIRSGSLDADTARDKLVAHNQRLVIHMARRYQGHGLELMDLIQEGTLGLLRATDTFDPDRGAQFSTYAVYWIQQAIQRAIADHGRLVRLPAHLHERVFQLEQTRKVLRDVFDREPTDTEVALKVGLLSPQETALGWLNLIMDWSPPPPLRKRLCKATQLVTRIRQWARPTLSLDLALPDEEISAAEDSDETEPDELTVADVIPDKATSLLELAVRQSQ